ncbi:MAG: hypothetical protein ABJC24_09775 [Chloroflexota bacterium]
MGHSYQILAHHRRTNYTDAVHHIGPDTNTPNHRWRARSGWRIHNIHTPTRGDDE